MKALVFKEWRENVKLAALGLVIYTVLLVVQYWGYIQSPSNLWRPLVDDELLMATGWFGGIFGAVLGWLQIHNERRPDLWAFLLHRPITRTEIFLGKAVAGLGLYAVVAGVPLVCFVTWAAWPGHVATPFEPAMLKSLTAMFLMGILYYFAGMLTGLRQARWYASRALGVGVALIVTLSLLVLPTFWQALLVIFIGAGMLATAGWGGFQSHGYYRGQPAWGKAALTGSVLVSCTIVVFLAGVTLANFLGRPDRNMKWTRYQVTEDGAIVKVTEGPGKASEIVDLEGKPVMDGATGRKAELSTLERRFVEADHIYVPRNDELDFGSWMVADQSLAVPWRATSDTLWYYWRRYDRLVGYDIATRRCIGSLGPQGFARDLVGSGDRFSTPGRLAEARTLRTATAVYAVNLEQREVKPLFTTTSDDPILAVSEFMRHHQEWKHTGVVTKRFVHLLTVEGQPVWKTPYEPPSAAYRSMEIYCLKPPGQFMAWMAPDYEENERAEWKLPIHVSWLVGDQGVVKRAEVASLPPYRSEPGLSEELLAAAMPPALVATVHLMTESFRLPRLPERLLAFSWVSAVLVCVPIGWWLGRRYRFTLGAQAGWAVFHLLFGLPGLLAFLCVQEWPARVPCPNCQRLRLVDRAQCEHCATDFAPPEKTGTEVFAPLGASG